MAWRELNIEQLRALKEPMVVDVRSPCEHKTEHIPGSINVPLLSDNERTKVGTTYKEEGELAARRLALAIISPKIPSIVDAIFQLERQHGQPLVIYCWRGGLRSEAVASVLSIGGIDCFRLTGGYKAFRRQVVNDLQSDKYNFKPLVLHGLTGAGKTEILNELDKRGFGVIDLESLSNHRGSVFGGIGLVDQPTQKNFEAQLWIVLANLSSDIVFLESESRKIGKISLPDCIYSRILKGTAILVTDTLENRINRICQSYWQNPSKDAVLEAIDCLKVLNVGLGARSINNLKRLISCGQIEEAIKLLLTNYYDPMYSKHIKKHFPYALEISGEDPNVAADQIIAWNYGNLDKTTSKALSARG